MPWNRVMFDSQDMNIDYFEMLRSCDHLLLKTLLSHMRRLCFSMSESADSSKGEFLFASNHLERIIDLKLGSETPLLEEGLKLAYVMIAVAERVSQAHYVFTRFVWFNVQVRSQVPTSTSAVGKAQWALACYCASILRRYWVESGWTIECSDV